MNSTKENAVHWNYRSWILWVKLMLMIIWRWKQVMVLMIIDRVNNSVFSARWGMRKGGILNVWFVFRPALLSHSTRVPNNRFVRLSEFFHDAVDNWIRTISKPRCGIPFNRGGGTNCPHERVLAGILYISPVSVSVSRSKIFHSVDLIRRSVPRAKSLYDHTQLWPWQCYCVVRVHVIVWKSPHALRTCRFKLTLTVVIKF